MANPTKAKAQKKYIKKCPPTYADLSFIPLLLWSTEQLFVETCVILHDIALCNQHTT
jgi:hypothetical protein